MQKKAYAKINLALDVTGKLDNGYHLVRMVMENISLCDEIYLEKSSIEGVRMTCSRDDLSCGDDNLVVRAAKAIFEAAGLENAGIDIKLTKNIPMAAGLAGGSTDAAAVLTGINELFELGFDKRKLCEIGVKLGADIPYCIMGGSYVAEGIGEKLTPAPCPPGAYIAIVKPPIDVSTKYVYEHLDSEGVMSHPDIDGMLEAMEQGHLQGVCDRLANVLRDVTVNKYPIVRELEDFLKGEGAMGALMSGSGPTVFGIFEDCTDCLDAIAKVKEKYPEVFAQDAKFVF